MKTNTTHVSFQTIKIKTQMAIRTRKKSSFYFQVRESPAPLNIPTPTPCTKPGKAKSFGKGKQLRRNIQMYGGLVTLFVHFQQIEKSSFI